MEKKNKKKEYDIINLTQEIQKFGFTLKKFVF